MSARTPFVVLLLIGCVFLAPRWAHAGAGFWKQFVIVDVGSGNSYMGDSVGANFDGEDLGTWYRGDQRFLNGAEANTWESDGDWADNVRFFYRISSDKSGSFTQITLDWRSTDGGNKRWDQTAEAILLTGYAPDEYFLEVFFQGQGNWDEGDWQFYDSDSPDYAATFEIEALSDPSSVSATAASTTQINLSWAKNAQGHDVMVVRSTDASFTAPSQGTAYTAGSSSIGGDPVIYRGSGTSFNDTGLTPGRTYYYKFYSENNSYYSDGVTANEATDCFTAGPSGLHASATNTTDFTAAWSSYTGATGYRLDVSESEDFSGGGGGGLLISQYYEGASNNKWIELYNAGSSSVDLSAGDYRLGVWFNAVREGWKSGSAPGNAIALSGTIAAGGTYLVAHSSAANPSYASADLSTGSLSFNGDDSVVLYTGSSYSTANIVDSIGLTGNTLPNTSRVRKNSITTGKTATTDYDSGDWDTYTYASVDSATAGNPERMGEHEVASSSSYVDGFEDLNVGNVTSYEVTGLDADTTYYYRVRAVNDYCTSGNSTTQSVTTLAPVPAITLANNGTQVSAANVAAGTTAHVLHTFSLAVTTADATLTEVDFTTAGTYQTADISNLKLRYSTDATLDGGDATLDTIAAPAAAGAKSFTGLSQTITAGNTGYFFVTADIAASPTAGRTISVNAIATGDLTFSSGTKSGSTTGGGAQTIITVPTLSSPTATSIGQTSATLGANVTANGGMTLSSRGTVWGTSSNPTGNALPEGNTGTGVFTHNRTGLSQGTRYFYRGYAVNSVAGTGYSPNGSFYTEPGQVSGVTLVPSATGMTVEWTAGADSDGTIVVMKTDASITAPSDGTVHAADANFGDGANLGGGSFVVYRGSGTSVDVTGLTAGTTYYVEVFAYAGAVADSGDDYGINYRQTGPETADAQTCPAAPVVQSETDVTASSFTANWDASTGAASYQLDVSSTAFGGGDGGLFISEVADPGDNFNARFVELYNASGDEIDFDSETWYLSRQANGGNWADIELTGTVADGETFVVAYNTTYDSAYSDTADQYDGAITGNGDDGYFLYSGGDHTAGTLVDAYGVINVDGTGEDWEYEDSHAVRDSSIAEGNDTWTSSEWTITAADVADVTPRSHTGPAGGSATYVSGYSNRTVAGTSESVTGLVADTTYYYRVRAVGDDCTSTNSASEEVTTSVGGTFVTIDNTGSPAAGNIAAGTTDAVLFGFRLTPTDSLDFTGLDLTTAGTATSSDLSNFEVVYDADNSGTYNVGDSIVSSAAQALDDPISFTITGQTGFDTARRYLVIADVAGAATAGSDITCSIAAASDVATTAGESGTAAGNAQTVTVAVAIDNTGSPAAANIPAGTANAVLFGFELDITGTVDFTALTLTSAGTATGTELSNFEVVYDADGDGEVDGGESVVSDSVAFGATIVFDMDPSEEGVTGTRKYLVIADVAAGATLGRTFTGSIAAAGDVTTTGDESGTAAGFAQTIVAAEPTTHASGITFSAIETDQMNVAWTDGDGDYRIVVVREGDAVNWTPSDFTAPSGVNADYSIADDQGSGNKISYSGSGSSFTLSGLSTGTTYHVAIFEYNGSGTTVNYYTGGTPPTGSEATLCLDVPAGLHASVTNLTDFTAAWSSVSGASGYALDVSAYETFSGSSEPINEDFTDFSDWTDSGTAEDNLASHYGVAAPCRALGVGDTLTSPAVDFPTQLVFYVDASGGGNGTTTTNYYSLNGGSTWLPLGTFTVTEAGATETQALNSSPDLSGETNVLFRFVSAFNTWYLDDVIVRSAADAYVPGYEGRPVSGTSQSVTGLTGEVTYYFRVRGTNATCIGGYSSTASVTMPSQPGIGFGPASLSPSSTLGSNPSASAFAVTNVGGATLSYTISTNASWLSVSPVSGSLTANNDEQHTVTYQTLAGMQPGVSNATITITDGSASNSPQTIAVAWTINAIPNPSVATVTGEGAEYIVLDWTKHASHDVMIVHREGVAVGALNQGTAYAVGGAAGGGTVIYKGAGSSLEHIVTPGATHHYAFFSLNNDYYSSGLTDNEAMPAYRVGEIVEPFAYTNTGTLATSGQGNGGQGWDAGWTGNTGDFHLDSGSFADQTNYPDTAGNKVRVTPPDDALRSVFRELDQTFSSGRMYAAYIMNYQYDGADKYAGLSLYWNDTDEKLFAGEVFGADQRLGIDGTSSSRELTAGVGNDYIIVLRYDWGDGEARAIAYEIGADAVPVAEPSTWDVTVSKASNVVGSVNSVRLAAGAGPGAGTPGNVFFDEVRVATNWSDLIGIVPEPPDDPDSFSATVDGSEMVRLSWEKNGNDDDVLILHKYTAISVDPTGGESYSVGDDIDGAKVIYTGGATALEHVVPDGSNHYYKAYSELGDYYSDALATNVSTDAYQAFEVVNPFAYTNNTTLGTSTVGGQGFGANFWATGGSGSWTVHQNPTTATGEAPIFFDLDNYPPMAGNLVRLTGLGDNQSGYTARTLDETYSTGVVYVAFMMSYQYDGSNKWAGLSFYDGGTERAFFGKGGGNNWHTFAIGDGTTTWWSDQDLRGTHTNDGRGHTGRVHLVVGKYDFENDRLQGRVYEQLANEFPESEPETWHATQEGVSFASFDRIRLQAGSSDAGATIGSAQFDEVRIAREWSQLVAGVCPTWVGDNEGPSGTLWLGDSANFKVESFPIGPGQTSLLNIHWADDTSQSFGMDFWKFEDNNTFWTNLVQMTLAGTHTNNFTVSAGACSETSTNTTFVVSPLNPPTSPDAERDTVFTNSQINLSWTKNAQALDVLVLRRTSDTSWPSPEQGQTYFAGDPVGDAVVVYRGADTSVNDSGLAPDTTYYYRFYSENWSYYSTNVVSADASTADGVHEIIVDGDPSDWVGTSPIPLNSGRVSANEYIWRDKTGEVRRDNANHPNADMEEFRVFADNTYVYFLAVITNITDTAHPFVSIGVDTRRDGSSTAMNWLGDDANTFVDGDYFGPGQEHFPEYQINVHSVGGSPQVEAFAHDGGEWYTPAGVQVAISAADDAVEIRVERAALGLSGSVAGRFTVAAYLNSGAWNNEGGGTLFIAEGTPHALDAVSIAPYGVADNAYAMSAWDEDLSDSDIDFFFDVGFGGSAIQANLRPTQPVLVSPTNNATVVANPLLRWQPSSDADGEVTGYLLEVSTNANFNGTSGTENGSVFLRVNLSATTTNYALTTIDDQYYWRVRARDTAGELSRATSHVFNVVGKLDNDGPLPTLLYIGTNVQGYLDGDYDAQIAQFGPIQDVTDAEIRDTNNVIGYVLRWEDASGVYATNRMRSDGGAPDPGGFAWNIVSDDGRVSPNWDIIEYQYDAGGTLTNTTEWEIDKPFWGTNVLATGNSDQVITTYVENAFSIEDFNELTEYFLTVSAEDNYSEGGSWWEFGTWNSYQTFTTITYSGWALDGPNSARNVTTNSLIRIRVRDDDIDPPIPSMEQWSDVPMIISNTTAGRLSHTGAGQAAIYQITDGALAADNDLTVMFNVWDRFSGLRRGTDPTTDVDGITLTNSRVTIEGWITNNTAAYRADLSDADSTHDESYSTWEFNPLYDDLGDLWGPNVHAPVSSTNRILLHMFDDDLDRSGDQENRLMTMGHIQLSDDDTEAPIVHEFTVEGQGITDDGRLSAGGIAIVGVNGHPATGDGGTGGESFSFVVLSPFPEGTRVWFTDAGWSNHTEQVWANTNEFHLAFWDSSGSEAVGDVITLEINNINNAGDQVAVYQYDGETSPETDPENVRWIYALNMGSEWLENHPGGGGTNNQNSALYYGLSNEVTAIDIIGTGSGRVNWQYIGARSGTASDLLAAISTRANWQQVSSVAQDMDLADIFDGGFTVLGPGDLDWDFPILTDAQVNQGGYVVTGLVQDVTTGLQPTGTGWSPPPYFALISNEDQQVSSNNFGAGFSASLTTVQTNTLAAAAGVYERIVLGEHEARLVVSDSDNDRPSDNRITTNSMTLLVVDDDPYAPQIGPTRIRVEMGGETLAPVPNTVAERLAGWNFNDVGDRFAVSHGNGEITYNLGGSINWYGGSTINAVDGDGAGEAFSPTAAGNIGGYFQFALDMSDYMSLVMTFAGQRTTTGYDENQVSYSLDGVAFTPFGDPFDLPSSFAVQTFDFGSVPGLNGQSEVFIRITLGVDVASGGGNNRYDNIQFHAHPLDDLIFEVTDAQLAEVDALNPLEFGFNVYDPISGVARGAAQDGTNMSVTIDGLFDEDSGYDDGLSSASTFVTNSMSVWAYNTEIPYEDRGTLYGDGETLRTMTATFADLDDDRPNDRSWQSNVVFGSLRVIDDDVDAPVAATHRFGGTGGTPLRALQVTTNDATPQVLTSANDPLVRGPRLSTASGNNADTGTVFVLTDGEMADPETYGIRFAFGALDTFSEVARPGSDLDEVMRFSLGDVVVDNTAGFDAGLSTTQTATNQVLTNVWTLTRTWSLEDITTMMEAGDLPVTVTIADTDDDRPDDQAILEENRVGFISVVDDDIYPPLMGALDLSISSTHNLYIMGFEEYHGWTNGQNFNYVDWECHVDGDVWVGNDVNIPPIAGDMPSQVRVMGMRNNLGEEAWLQMPSREAPGTFFAWAKLSSAGDREVILEGRQDPLDSWTDFGTRNVTSADWILFSWPINETGEWTLRLRRVSDGGTPTVYFDDLVLTKLPAWTNEVEMTVSFEEAEDPSGIDEYRHVSASDPDWRGGTNVTEGVEVPDRLGSQISLVEGIVTGFVFAVDADVDRSNDQLRNPGMPYVVRIDHTPPQRPTGVEATSAEGGVLLHFVDIDETTDIGIRWNPFANEATAAGPRESDGLELSPWDTFVFSYVELDDLGDPIAGAPTQTVTRAAAGYEPLGEWGATNVVLMDLNFDTHYRVSLQGRDEAGNMGPITNITGNTARFIVTQGLARTSTRSDIFWEARTDTNGLVTREYDLIHADHVDYGDHMQAQWRWDLVASVSSNWAMDTNSIFGDEMRFFRATPKGRWESPTRPVASEEVYVAKPVRLGAGQNWVAFPGIPDTNTVARVFGSGLPQGSMPASSTRITWYDRLTLEEQAQAPTQQVWLATGGEWQFSIGGEGSADDVLVPLGQGVIVELPPGHTNSSFLFIGRVPTNSMSQTITGNGAFNFVGFRIPRRMHPSEMNLLESGFTDGTSPLNSDWIWKYNREGPDGESGGVSAVYTYFNGAWRHLSGSPMSSAPVFGPDDALVILTSGSGSDWTWTINAADYYAPPSRSLDP